MATIREEIDHCYDVVARSQDDEWDAAADRLVALHELCELRRPLSDDWAMMLSMGGCSCQGRNL